MIHLLLASILLWQKDTSHSIPAHAHVAGGVDATGSGPSDVNGDVDGPSIGNTKGNGNGNGDVQLSSVQVATAG